ncbi:hypothetical protein JD276_14060 [Leucobacter sp. CSA1]|uniref:Uncharacterized protein n=1 Tax=Leucobacter chromiisoli TaxID=2796471 RepID=A0A934Q9C4_9MICO|nr:hypothetical protein [Leucobacter chromiisoli]MBK0420158.1 hypothetical protein [Leucobacter chromiisoli]
MTKVVVANRLERDGKTYKGGDVVDVSPAEARDLLGLGKVREQGTEKGSAAPVKEAKNG